MKKRLRQCLAIILILTQIIYVVPNTLSKVQAANFSASVTGNGATDIVNVALAQYAKTGGQLGYRADWCAYFVGDCARAVNQSRAIPANGVVGTLKNNVIAAGGSVVNSPKPGDLAFMDWGKGGHYYHVEIVYSVSGSTVYTIGGNSGPKATNTNTNVSITDM